MSGSLYICRKGGAIIHTPWSRNLKNYGRRVKQQLKSQLLLVNFYFVLPQFQIKRACFSFVFPAYVQLCTHNLALYFFRTYSAANFKISPHKFVSHAHQQPVHRLPRHQKMINLNNRQKIQYLPNKVSIFE